ncbi:hypothetical protein [Paramagnetospirillum magneticum]|uniref:Uncharacterized protein n=1 Tax=Paramagnetospirillum magneticum (strain ATCC 700264 / AMB-1) TaxID=342108 RepID=Q2W745_PARM1|nr:hypothetical protein [Paramagnetospirillum magneticum]BAE50330.1 hypothetical protein amb1526 [Paramagnetospirillum magneticum AMB-1]
MIGLALKAMGLDPAGLAGRLVGPLLLAAAALAIGSYVLWQRAEIAELTTDKVELTRDRDVWHGASEDNRRAAETIRIEGALAVAAIAADRDAALARLANNHQARKEVAHAAQTQDAPPAGVLLVARDQLARLRADAFSAGGHRDQGREDRTAGRDPDLRP